MTKIKDEKKKQKKEIESFSKTQEILTKILKES